MGYRHINRHIVFSCISLLGLFSAKAQALTWTGEPGYTSDGVQPDSGYNNVNFVFRVRWLSNIGRAINQPQLYIYRTGGGLISGSPFVMTLDGPTESQCWANYSVLFCGVYMYSVTSLVPGDYSYSIYAKNVENDYSSISSDGPVVLNHAPALSWTGETNYSVGGLSPSVGTTVDSFVFRVKYFDVDGESPASGYPKLHIKQGNVEIFGSPFTMASGSGDNTGVIYSYSTVLVNPGTDYSYYFEAQDASNAIATGAPLTPVDAPDVFGTLLSWTGEAEYTTSGVSPLSGDRNTNFAFRVKYFDAGGAPVAGPKLHMKKNGAEIAGSPFTMSTVSGSYNPGVIYNVSIALSPGNYVSYFEAKDSNGNDTGGAPTQEALAPQVSNQLEVSHSRTCTVIPWRS